MVACVPPMRRVWGSNPAPAENVEMYDRHYIGKWSVNGRHVVVKVHQSKIGFSSGCSWNSIGKRLAYGWQIITFYKY